MKSSVFIFLFLSYFVNGQNNVTILGRISDQDGNPLHDAKVRLFQDDYADLYTVTDKNGLFIFRNVKSDDSYIISSEKGTYLDKTDIYHHDFKRSKDTAYITFSLRQRSIASIDISTIGEKDLGITLEEAIKRFKIDTTEAIIQQEPPSIARGIETELGDSTIIYLQINRKGLFRRNDYKYILNEKVIGIGLAFTNCKKKSWGTGFVWTGMQNPYCKPNSRTGTRKSISDTIPSMLLGKFTDDYGINYEINDTLWTLLPKAKYHIISWNVGEQYLLARNDDSNAYEPGLYTRIDYMNFNNMEPYLWGFCLTTYNAKTVEEARDKAKADRQNPMKGCNGFPFSRMKRTE